jgi:hypothetical protein
MFESFEHSIFGFRIYHTLNVHNINSYRVEEVPGPLDPGIYSSSIWSGFIKAFAYSKSKSLLITRSCISGSI